MENILIAGCGYIGQTLGVLLAQDGHTVWGLRRTPDGLPPGIRPVAADLCNPVSLAELPQAIDAVYYTTGADVFDESAYRRAYVEGLGNLIDALESQGQIPKRFIFTSSTGVYHQNDGSLLDEESPTAPTRFSGRYLLEGEARLATVAYPTVVLRLGGIYGPGRTRLLDEVRAGRARRMPGILNLIHRDDAAGILRHLLALSEPARVYLGVDDTPVYRDTLLAWMSDQLGVPVPPAAEAGDVTESQRGGDRRFRNARIKAAGYQFLHPSYREGYAALL